jgi:hypothetical protein
MGIIKAAKAVYGGYKDYARKDAEIDAQANRNLRGKFGNASQEADMNMLAKEIRKVRRERGGLSLVQSIRERYNSY